MIKMQKGLQKRQRLTFHWVSSIAWQKSTSIPQILILRFEPHHHHQKRARTRESEHRNPLGETKYRINPTYFIEVFWTERVGNTPKEITTVHNFCGLTKESSTSTTTSAPQTHHSKKSEVIFRVTCNLTLIIFWMVAKKNSEEDVLSLTSNPWTWDIEAGGPGVWCQPRQHLEIKTQREK